MPMSKLQPSGISGRAEDIYQAIDKISGHDCEFAIDYLIHNFRKFKKYRKSKEAEKQRTEKETISILAELYNSSSHQEKEKFTPKLFIPQRSVIDSLKQFQQEGVDPWGDDPQADNQNDESKVIHDDGTYNKFTYSENLSELHRMYIQEHPEAEISYTYFCNAVHGLYIQKSRGTDLCPLCETA
ncbi:MAG: hypothetical protein EZS28_018283 [Streblomastix strix]|uniref:Uncharacterized protein n=1 Tax=Streblomastix strix TaxID=222440 RepID=A0A5J4VU74_9EUKA|nr:MAG: hypothetical protein EZS28_018283 [Streblomastix strix]